MIKRIGLMTLISLALFGLGCTSPAHRIKKNPEMFNSFPPAVQEKVQKGEVDVGFSADMVFIALGLPDRKYQRTTAEGTKEVWAYVDYRYKYEQQLVRGNFRYRDANGRMRTTTDSVWVDVQTKTEFERIRVEFQGDKVAAIDRLEE